MSAGRLKIGAALVFTSPFVPMLFQGEEWGASTPFQYFTDYPEPKLAKAVRQGRCQEFAAFGWKSETIPHPQARETFERSKMNWAELSHEPHAGLLDWHCRLIRLRRHEPELTDGRLDRVRAHYNEAARWLMVERGRISVACNLADRPQRVPIRAGRHRLLMASETVEQSAHHSIMLPPDSVAIMKLMRRN